MFVNYVLFLILGSEVRALALALRVRKGMICVAVFLSPSQ